MLPNAGTVNGAIKCQQISGGDGYSTMADGTQTFRFAFGPLSAWPITSDGSMHYSQPLPAIINIPAGGKASLRLVNLSVAEYFT